MRFVRIYQARAMTEPQKRQVRAWIRQVAGFVRRIEADSSTESEEREMLRQVYEHWRTVDRWLRRKKGAARSGVDVGMTSEAVRRR